MSTDLDERDQRIADLEAELAAERARCGALINAYARRAALAEDESHRMHTALGPPADDNIHIRVEIFDGAVQWRNASIIERKAFEHAVQPGVVLGTEVERMARETASDWWAKARR